MFEYTTDRFVNVSKIIAANLYTKNGEIRVAIDLDVAGTDKNCLYTSTFANRDLAVAYCKALPVLVAQH